MPTAEDTDGRTVFTADPKGYVDTFPPDASTLFGWSPEEVIGKKRVTLFHKPEALRELLPRFMRLATERGVVREEAVMVRKDKSEFPADLRVTPIFGSEDFAGFRIEVRRVED